MEIVWREREHEVVDNLALNDTETITTLRNCGLLNFSQVANMQAQKPLLILLIRY